MQEQGGGCAASSAVAIKTEPAVAPAALDPRLSDLSRLFIVCGRGRKVDELRALFSPHGAIKHLHLALDRSKKSRGFAFLQYENPANAAVAINKLDHFKLEDGHILKVTVAKERPASGNGKLKRDQHARQDQDEKTEGLGDEDDGGIDAGLPGKRQRSSPPVTSLPLGINLVSSAVNAANFVLETHRVERFGAKTLTIKKEVQQRNTLLPAKACKDELMEPSDEIQVQQVLDAMMTVMEQQSKLGDDLFAAYQQVNVTSNGGDKHKKCVQNLMVVVPGTSEDALATSIRSVSLASTPMTTRGSRLDLLRASGEPARESKAIPPRPKHHLRRRRQSLDGSGSSAEDGSDGSGIRRKRSNTTTSPPPTLKHLNQPLSPPRTFSDHCDISLSPETQKSEIIPKKVGKRQSSDNSIEESYRLAKLQATQERRDYGGTKLDRGPVRPTSTNADSSYRKERDINLEFKTELTEPVRTKLFFTSTYKFTEQELEAMFAVYGNFDSVELVKSFGRVKTMAYVRYLESSTAAFVVKSFREESSQGEENPEKSEFMTLSFAHETVQLQQRTRRAPFPERALENSSNLYSNPSTGTNSAPSRSTNMTSGGKDRLWVLLLYDRFLATHMLSSVVSSLSGMEFMDIKVVKSSGEAQGVAFVKFDSEANTTHAALQLHQMELPLGSGKFLQAIVILAPSLFTTTHGNNSLSTNESMRLDRSAGERVVTGSSKDVDLRAVEAQFAHLMRSTEHQQSRDAAAFPRYCSMPSPSSTAPNLTGVCPPSHSAGFHTSINVSGGVEYYPMQLVTYPPPPPQQPFQPYGNYTGPMSYQQLPQHQSFGNVPNWMENAPYYQSGVPQQYPFSCAPEQEVMNHNVRAAENLDIYASSPKPRSSRSSSDQMDVEDGNSSSSIQPSSSIHVSTSEPLELMMLVSALQDCHGVVSFAKNTANGSELAGYMVEFSNETQALEAVCKLDGLLCGGQKLRVAKSVSTRRRGGGSGKARSGSGRRKRQRVDPRSRK